MATSEGASSGAPPAEAMTPAVEPSGRITRTRPASASATQSVRVAASNATPTGFVNGPPARATLPRFRPVVGSTL